MPRLHAGDVIKMPQDGYCYVGAVNDCRAVARKILRDDVSKLRSMYVFDVPVSGKVLGVDCLSISARSDVDVMVNIPVLEHFLRTNLKHESMPWRE